MTKDRSILREKPFHFHARAHNGYAVSLLHMLDQLLEMSRLTI